MRSKVGTILSAAAVALVVLSLATGWAGAVPQTLPRLAQGGTMLQGMVPSVVSYQGQVAVGGSPYNGTGYFKFAIVNEPRTLTLWSNDGTSGEADEPKTAVALAVANGLFNVLLGDTSLPGMTEPLPPDRFEPVACYLRVWFSQDDASYQLLSPDRRIAAVPFALWAEEAENANLLGGNTVGSASGRIPLNNSALNSTLNADLLDGEHGDYYRNASNIDAGTLSASRFSAHADLSAEGYLGNASGDLAQNNGVMQQTLNADTVDGQHASELGVPSGAIVLGFPGDSRLPAAGFTDLGPSIELWQSTGLSGAPTNRLDHSVVWTGSEMIVWGGEGSSPSYKNDGGRYDPTTDTWTPTTTAGAPTGRSGHSAVWTGSEMIIWGGYDGTDYTNSGARYNPSTDTWTSISTTGAPPGRSYHTALWTGSEMIVWGGAGGSPLYRNDGGRYDPATNTWTGVTTTGAPSGRRNFAAVWTGSEMIVWGGQTTSVTYFDDGGRYNPATDSWLGMSATNAPSARHSLTAVWTGSVMIVWGGEGTGYNNDGRTYDPLSNWWSWITTTAAPGARQSHTAVWTGSEMIVWGGYAGVGEYWNDGGRYNLEMDTWQDITTMSAPSPRDNHTAVWTGSCMIIWGGRNSYSSGGRFSRLHLYQKP